MKRIIPADRPHQPGEQSDHSSNDDLLHDLRAAVADLKAINPWAGFFRFTSLGCVTVGLAVLTWHASHLSGFVLGAIATSIPYAFWLICTHDATHRSLTGWAWYDTLMPRLISWPMLWPVGTYNQLHRLHHGWNGSDLRDPERIQWTAADYQSAPAWQRGYVRYQWVVDIFILGGLGAIFKTFANGLKLRDNAPHLPAQMSIDAVGIIVVQTAILSFLYLQKISLGKYLLFWLLLERGISVIIETRDHLEHYGLWQQASNYQLTQLYACRNVKAAGWVNWLMGGLPYHSVHHAFPQIPYYQLPEAFRRIQSVLHRHQLPPMVMESGYLAASLRLSTHPSLIDPGERDKMLKSTK
ncbi:MAG: fatty acid desaturase [Phormidesmis sp.]